MASGLGDIIQAPSTRLELDDLLQARCGLAASPVASDGL